MHIFVISGFHSLKYILPPNSISFDEAQEYCIVMRKRTQNICKYQKVLYFSKIQNIWIQMFSTYPFPRISTLYILTYYILSCTLMIIKVDFAIFQYLPQNEAFWILDSCGSAVAHFIKKLDSTCLSNQSIIFLQNFNL